MYKNKFVESKTDISALNIRIVSKIWYWIMVNYGYWHGTLIGCPLEIIDYK